MKFAYFGNHWDSYQLFELYHELHKLTSVAHALEGLAHLESGLDAAEPQLHVVAQRVRATTAMRCSTHTSLLNLSARNIKWVTIQITTRGLRKEFPSFTSMSILSPKGNRRNEINGQPSPEGHDVLAIMVTLCRKLSYPPPLITFSDAGAKCEFPLVPRRQHIGQVH